MTGPQLLALRALDEPRFLSLVGEALEQEPQRVRGPSLQNGGSALPDRYTRIAERLGISRRTLVRILNRYPHLKEKGPPCPP